MSSFTPDILTTLITNDGQHSADPNSVGWKGASIASIEISGIEYQVYGYWDKDDKVCLATRQIGGAWTITTTAISAGSPFDGHNPVLVGLDPNGYIHIAYDLHDTALKYRRSVNPINTFDGTLTDVLAWVGTNESYVCYPSFFNDPSGNLYVMFRNFPTGGAGGDVYFYKYNHGTTAWAAATGTGTGGKLIDGISDNMWPYFWQPAFDSDFGSGGVMHFFWTWRTNDTGNYADIDYIYWDGTDFHQAGGGAQTIPARTGNDAAAVSWVANDMQPTVLSQAVYADSDGYPHIAYARKDDTYCHLFHAWYSGSEWVAAKLTNTNVSAMTSLWPILAIDRSNDVVYIIYTDWVDTDGTNGTLLLQKSEPADYTTWSKFVIYPYPTTINGGGGNYGPKYDVQKWGRDSLFIIPIEYWEGGQTSLPIRLFEPSFGSAKTYVYGVTTEAIP